MTLYVRWTGCLLLFGSCVFWGYREGVRLSRRCQELEELMQVILQMKGEVRYGSIPLPEIFDRIGNRFCAKEGVSGKRTAAWLFGLSKRLEKSTEPFERIWREEAEKGWKNSCLKEDDLELLRQFGDSLGYADRALQLELLEYGLEQFSNQKKEAAKTEGIYGRLYRSLGVLGGALLVLLVL